jgi:oligoendopeptidase F
MTSVQSRSEVPIEQKWNAESLFATPAAWQTEASAAPELIGSLARFKGHLGDSAQTLLEALQTQEQVLRRVGKVYMYAMMNANADTTDSAFDEMSGQSQALFGRFMATISFIEPEILAIGQDRLKEWMAQDAKLAVFDHFFEDLFRKQAHVRSAEVEEVLGLAQEPFGVIPNTENVLTNADMVFKDARTSTGETVPVIQGNWESHLNNPDRELRRTTWESYQDGYLALKNTLASNLAAAIKRDVFFARARRYNSALEASMDASNIPVSVFHTTIETYKRHLPTWHRYWGVLRRALGVEKLHGYDAHAPFTSKSPAIPFAQGVDWISAGLKPLGDDYVATLRQGCLQDRWVDRAVNQGKVAGAYSAGFPGTFPFIMMSYDDTILNLSTLAHELGHSMHSHSTWSHQPFAYADYSLFVAEVASNFHQAMVRAHLFQMNPDRDFQLAVIDEAMRNFHRYFFIMPNLARFELEMHERAEQGKSLTADVMNGRMAELFAEAYGPDVEVDPQRDGITWAQFGHLYANFYVYQYTTGISAANMLAQKVLREGPPAAAQYRKFLNAGSSLYPIDALKLAGVDMTTPDAVETTFGVLAGLVDRLEQLTAK